LLSLLERLAVAPFDEVKRTGVVRYVVLRANTRGEVLVAVVSGRSGWREGPALAAELLSQTPAVVGVVEQVNDHPGNVLFGMAPLRLLAGRDTLTENVAGVSVEVPPQAFLQVNREVAALAYRAIRDAAAARAPLGRLVDVYAGVGGISFTLAAANLGSELYAIEENPHATGSGARAMQDMAIAATSPMTKINFVTGAAETAAPLLPNADLVVLNPPRAGVSSALLTALAAARPRLAIYLSCNPDSLARDLAVLVGGGRRIASLVPFDMLPHTAHIEALAVLE
jgi:23S rRNA (uracil1939-C5)-methyltransferase